MSGVDHFEQARQSVENAKDDYEELEERLEEYEGFEECLAKIEDYGNEQLAWSFISSFRHHGLNKAKETISHI